MKLWWSIKSKRAIAGRFLFVNNNHNGLNGNNDLNNNGRFAGIAGWQVTGNNIKLIFFESKTIYCLIFIGKLCRMKKVMQMKLL